MQRFVYPSQGMSLVPTCGSVEGTSTDLAVDTRLGRQFPALARRGTLLALAPAVAPAGAVAPELEVPSFFLFSPWLSLASLEVISGPWNGGRPKPGGALRASEGSPRKAFLALPRRGRARRGAFLPRGRRGTAGGRGCRRWRTCCGAQT